MYNAGNTPERMRELGKLGGRPPGKKSKATLKKEAVMEEYRQMILKDAKRLFYSQSTLAHGQTYLFRINKKKVGKDTWVADGEPILVKKPEEMHAYLDGLIHNKVSLPFEPYYFLTAVQPSQQAIADMLDRAFGRARQVVGLEGPTPGSAVAIEINDQQYGRVINEEFQRLIATGVDTGASAGVAVDRAAETELPRTESGT
jgi:hypothetical protein